MPRTDRLSLYRTTIHDSNDMLVVTYHSTPIVTFDRNTREVTLRSGGWETVTTKRKMNQTSNQFNLGFAVSQKDHLWYVRLPDGGVVPFEDGMTFPLRDAISFANAS